MPRLTLGTRSQSLSLSPYLCLQIVAASTLPLSIVIVGVGQADFSNMDRLDADTTPLVDRRGRKMARDIVQFGMCERERRDRYGRGF